ncbi:MAG: tetratricopeptide repeat protein, partial [Mesorhizobium sp.]
MSRGTGTGARPFVAWLLRGRPFRLALAGLVILAGLGAPALASGKDYAVCFSDGKVDADRQIAACTPIAEDAAEIPDLRVQAYFVRGLTFAGKNDIDHAIADMDEVIALDPTYVRAYTNRGIGWESRQDFERAVADYSKAIALTPGDADIYVNRARALGKKGEHDRAIVDCDKAIDIDPANEVAYGVRAIAWEDKGNHARAAADFAKAASVGEDPATPYYDRALSWASKGKRTRAEADCKHIAGIDAEKGSACLRQIAEALGEPANRNGRATGSDTAETHNSRGVEWQEKDDHDRAIAEFGEAIRLDPANSTFYFNRAKSWGLKKDYARALADLDEAVRRDPANAQAYRVRGMTMARVGNSREAFADLDKAIEVSPDDPKSYFIRALVWETIDPDKAIADLDKAITLDPANADYREKRLSVQLDKRRAAGQPAEQVPDPASSQDYEATRAAPAAPQTAKPAAPPVYEPPQLYAKEDHSEIVAWYLKRGLEQQVGGYVGGAIDSFSSAIDLDPYNAEAFYNRALAEASQGNYAVAATDCRRAIDLDPKRGGSCNEHAPGEPAQSAAGKTRDPAAAKILIDRANARLAKYGAESALLDLAKAISLDPDNADAYLVRSRARALKGDEAGAVADCRRAIDLDPKRAGACGEQVANDSGEPNRPPEEKHPKPETAAPKLPVTAAELNAVGASIIAKRHNAEAANAIKNGDRLTEQHEYDQAIAEYDRAISLASDGAEARKRREAAEAAKGQSEANTENTHDLPAVVALLERGDALHKKRKYARAIAEYSRAVALAPNEPTAYSARALARLQKGEYDGALDDFNKAIELDP